MFGGYWRHHKQAQPIFGFTAREVAFMRSLSEGELTGFMDTLAEVRALPVATTAPLCEWC